MSDVRATTPAMAALRRAAEQGEPPVVTLQPSGWPMPKGYANGMLAEGRAVFVGGQIGWDEHGRFAEGLSAQVRRTLENTLAILAEAGAGPAHVVRMTWYVCSIAEYLAALPEIGAAYRETFGRHYPAMALVEVVRLVEAAARVEIETTAMI